MAKAKKGEAVALPFTILIDQREGLPYSFGGMSADSRDGGGPLLVSTRMTHLATGDYTIEGLETRVAVERKGGGDNGTADLYGTLGQGRDRFERELERLATYDYAAVVVEATWHDILAGAPHSRLSPKTVHRSVIAWQQRHPRVHWWVCGDRRLGEITTLRILERYWRDHVRPERAG